jgi:hypothetical protein
MSGSVEFSINIQKITASCNFLPVGSTSGGFLIFNNNIIRNGAGVQRNGRFVII